MFALIGCYNGSRVCCSPLYMFTDFASWGCAFIVTPVDCTEMKTEGKDGLKIFYRHPKCKCHTHILEIETRHDKMEIHFPFAE
jgi:hypothetical protein